MINEILQNPIYEGDLLLQKTYSTEGLPFQKKTNKGEVPQYFIRNNHEPVITRSEGQMVGKILEYRRNQMGLVNSGKNQNRYDFSSKIICSECGSTYHRQKISIGKPNERRMWRNIP